MENNLDELFRWIDDHDITRTKKNLNRDFSDAVPLVEILKKHYPKLVELHNYTPRNALSQKIANWDILNKKVLNKIKINLSYAEREDLAKAVPGAIEKLLCKVKLKVEKQAADEKSCETEEKVYYLEGLSMEDNGDAILDVKIKTGTKTSDQKLLPANTYNKMESNLAEKEEEIASLRQKVEHLESIVKVKEERINDLSRQLQTVTNGEGDRVASTPSRFFNKLF